MAATIIDKTATAAPVAKEATKEAVGALLTASPSSLASFPALSTVVVTVWAACKHLPTGAFNSAWVPLAIAMMLSYVIPAQFPGTQPGRVSAEAGGRDHLDSDQWRTACGGCARRLQCSQCRRRQARLVP
jgi:hypothetical protein